MISNESFIAIQGYMINELNLKGVELITFAVIEGFSRDGQGRFTGTAGYIAEWANCSKRAVFDALNSLVGKGFINKVEKLDNGQKFCEYFSVVKKLHPPMQKIHTPPEKISPPPHEKTSGYNNITLDNIDDTIFPLIVPPTKNDESSEKSRAKKQSNNGCRFENSEFCGDRCPDVFVDEAKAINPNINPFEEYKTFKDYWISRTGQIAVKRDWVATWRNWLRKAKSWSVGRVEKPSLMEQAKKIWDF